MTIELRRGPPLRLPPLRLPVRPPQAAAPRFRALALAGAGDVRDLARLMRPLEALAVPGAAPPLSVRGAPGGSRPPAGLVPLAVLGAGVRLSLRAPEALVAALAGPAADAPDAAGARLLALEIAIEGLMEVVDHRLGASVELVPEDARTLRDHWRAFDVDAGDAIRGDRHEVWLGVDLAGLGALVRALEGWPARPARAAVPLACAAEIGRFDLPRERLAALVPGDTILPGPGAIALGAGRLVVQGRAVARLRLDGTEAILEEAPAMSRHPADDFEADAEGPLADPLGGLPVRLTFRLGAREMTLAELSGLHPGSVVPLDIDEDEPVVEICAGGRVVGRGEIVAVAGRLGVHVLRVSGLG